MWVCGGALVWYGVVGRTADAWMCLYVCVRGCVCPSLYVINYLGHGLVVIEGLAHAHQHDAEDGRRVPDALQVPARQYQLLDDLA